ncbi:TRAP transporter substrate-binding protein DctP [Rhodococcus pseudokoreensis]|uniref:TRAP transporter substrate-binding protein DctP n=1 Tax=Rhodococcus pseudokoreensis TaxID=2811421 RepID=A0A974W7K8_9NOCA|nr:TRAP transporter substrate-binding protein DctP [Rhodococcus pseudokoreensis]QSE92768.1 TRAP transporter substrate-binding protein DctP [Rhodococcus pseudokoreensis]
MGRTTHAARFRSRARWGAAMATLLMLVSGCGTATGHDTGGTPDKPLVLRYADYTSARSGDGFRAFAADVTDHTDGRITFDEYWGGSLLTGTDMASGVRGGVADLGMFTATYYPSEFPLTDWLSRLGNLADTDYPRGVMQANAAQADFAMSSEQVNNQFENRGMKLLFSAHPITNYDILCKTPVTTLADATGKRIRSGGGMWDDEIRALGMTPVNLSIGETYEGLERGVIDCTLASPKTVTSYGFWEVAKHYTNLPLTGINAQYVVMNQEVWDSLAVEDQRVIWDAAYLWFQGYLEYEGLGLEKVLVDTGTNEHGLALHDPADDMLGAVKNQQAKVRASLPSTAPDRIESPELILRGYEDTMAKWHARLASLDLSRTTTDGGIDLTEYAAEVRSEVFDRHKP